MTVAKHISIDPQICHGKPCFKGTRIMVSTILELLESGKSYPEIRKGYPSVTREHIRAALHFAHQILEQSQFISFRSQEHAISH